MARRRRARAYDEENRSPRLVKPRDEARRVIQRQIDQGNELLTLPIKDKAELESTRKRYYTWTEFNETLLHTLFDTNKLSDEYRDLLFVGFGPQSLSQEVKELHDDVQGKCRKLESVLNRLDLYDAPQPVTLSQVSLPTETQAGVFVVHGRDIAIREAVARFLEHLVGNVVILHEQPNQGKTIIEKLERETGRGYAVVLLTGDDVGRVAGAEEDLKPRARQNVIFELGFFVGALGRNRVCILYEEGVELPSDYAGVVWIPLDAREGWHLGLARELKAAGFEVDFNRAV